MTKKIKFKIIDWKTEKVYQAEKTTEEYQEHLALVKEGETVQDTWCLIRIFDKTIPII